LRDDLFRLVSLLSHSFVLHLARKPTSRRTTFLGADQTEEAFLHFVKSWAHWIGTLALDRRVAKAA
ncbi:hypothetical protein, partial [Hoeflea sp.]